MINKTENSRKIAIIGIGLRFPKANNATEFWELLKNGVDMVTDFSVEELIASGIPASLAEREDYIKSKGVVEDVFSFDADFFLYSPKEAALIDPQQRIFLECGWSALEDAGINPLKHDKRIGVYAGCGINRYTTESPVVLSEPAEMFQRDIGNAPDYLASRVAYKLNLKGPAMTIQTACSTSLVAIHQACQAILNEDCDIAMAGGVSLGIPGKSGHLFSPGLIYSPDGRCKPFDAGANGIVRGQGAGIVILKRLSDAIADHDHIYGTILSSAINNDGADKIGFTAPGVAGQEKVIRAAQQKAGVSPASIGYIETHGTGTHLGDPLEMEALKNVFATGTVANSCAVGSVKSNMGHLDVAAGVAGLIKSVLCLYHHELVPTLHFQELNPYISFRDTPFYVNTAHTPWHAVDSPRRAAVSSFGLGGTNAHLILEEHSTQAISAPPQPYIPLFFSGNTPLVVKQKVAGMKRFLIKNPEASLKNVAYSQQKQHSFDFRWSMVCSDHEDAIRQLNDYREIFAARKNTVVFPVIFLFQGMATERKDLAKELYQYTHVFKEEVDRCIIILQQLFPDKYKDTAADLLFGWSSPKNDGILSHESLFIIQYALARYFMSMGIKPAAMLGYSGGEYVAACLSQVFTLEDALYIVTSRWKLLCNTPPGKMMVVRKPADAIRQIISILRLEVDVAGITTQDGCVVSGSEDGIYLLDKYLQNIGVKTTLLNSNHGFHSHLLNAALPKFESIFQQLKPGKPTIPYISSLTGDWIKPEEALSANYWSAQMREPVRFLDGIKALLDSPAYENALFLEVGPEQILSNLIAANPLKKKSQHFLFTQSSGKEASGNELKDLYSAVCHCWQYGFITGTPPVIKETEARFIPLPPYPFDRTVYHTSPLIRNTTVPTQNDDITRSSSLNENINEPATAYLTALWKNTLGTIGNIPDDSNFFLSGGDSLSGTAMLNKIKSHFNIELETGTLIRFPEFGALNDYVQQQLGVKNKNNNPIVQHLQTGEPGHPTLVLIHPVGGELFIFRDWLKTLPSCYPVLGISSPLLSGLNLQETSIEDLAHHYVSLLQEKNIFHNCILAGVSFGGVVAFEMAAVLSARGRHLPLLIMVDAPAVPADFTLHDKRVMNAEDVELNILRLHYDALMKYRPPHIHTNIIFFHPTAARPATPLGWEKFWSEYTSGDYSSYQVPGDHITMNYLPNVTVIADGIVEAASGIYFHEAVDENFNNK
jgi:acyl transferase domain-containing protein/thioesterase domain-containing protein